MQLDLEHHLSERKDRVVAAEAKAAGGEAQREHHDEPKGPATGTHRRDHKAELKKFSATGYPASRPMHKEVYFESILALYLPAAIMRFSFFFFENTQASVLFQFFVTSF